MKALKIIGNIFGILLSVVVSVALLAVLIATPVITSLTLVVEPETVHAVVIQPEVVDMITEIPVVSESLEAAGMDTEFVHEVAQTKFFEDLIHLYTDEAVDGVIGEQTEHVTVQQVQQVIENNKQEVIDIVRPISDNYTDDGQIASDEEIVEMIDYAVTTYGQAVLDAIPSGQDLVNLINGYSGDISGLVDSYGPSVNSAVVVGSPLKMDLEGSGQPQLGLEGVDTQQFVSTFVKLLLDGTVTKVLIAAIVLLSVLILAFRWPRGKGLMWLTVIYLIGGSVMYAVGTLLSYRPFEEELAHYFHIAVVIFDLIAVHIRNYAIAFWIVAGVCLVLFIAIRVLLNVLQKRGKAKENALAVEAVEEASVPVEEAPTAGEIPEVVEVPIAEEAAIEEGISEPEETIVDEEASVKEEISEAEEPPALEETASVE